MPIVDINLGGNLDSRLTSIIKKMDDLNNSINRVNRNVNNLGGSGFRGLLSNIAHVSNAGDRLINTFTRLKFVIGTVGIALGAKAGFSVIIDQMVNANKELEGVIASYRANLQDFNGAQAKQASDYLKKVAIDSPFSFQELSSQTKGLMILSKGFNDSYKKMLDFAQILAAYDPAQGLQGAGIAIREAMSGDFRSMFMRFEMPRSLFNKYKDAGLDPVSIIENVFKDMRLDKTLVDNMAKTFAGRVDQAKDMLEQAFMRMGESGFYNLSYYMTKIVESLNAARQPGTEFSTMIEKINSKIGRLVDTTLSWLRLDSGAGSGFVVAMQYMSGAIDFVTIKMDRVMRLIDEWGGLGKVIDNVAKFLKAVYTGIATGTKYAIAFATSFYKGIYSVLQFFGILKKDGKETWEQIVELIAKWGTFLLLLKASGVISVASMFFKIGMGISSMLSFMSQTSTINAFTGALAQLYGVVGTFVTGGGGILMTVARALGLMAPLIGATGVALYNSNSIRNNENLTDRQKKQASTAHDLYTLVGAGLGGILGAVLGGPMGAYFGASAGAVFLSYVSKWDISEKMVKANTDFKEIVGGFLAVAQQLQETNRDLQNSINSTQGIKKREEMFDKMNKFTDLKGNSFNTPEEFMNASRSGNVKAIFGTGMSGIKDYLEMYQKNIRIGGKQTDPVVQDLIEKAKKDVALRTQLYNSEVKRADIEKLTGQKREDRLKEAKESLIFAQELAKTLGMSNVAYDKYGVGKKGKLIATGGKGSLDISNLGKLMEYVQDAEKKTGDMLTNNRDVTGKTLSKNKPAQKAITSYNNMYKYFSESLQNNLITDIQSMMEGTFSSKKESAMIKSFNESIAVTNATAGKQDQKKIYDNSMKILFGTNKKSAMDTAAKKIIQEQYDSFVKASQGGASVQVLEKMAQNFQPEVLAKMASHGSIGINNAQQYLGLTTMGAMGGKSGKGVLNLHGGSIASILNNAVTKGMLGSTGAGLSNLRNYVNTDAFKSDTARLTKELAINERLNTMGGKSQGEQAKSLQEIDAIRSGRLDLGAVYKEQAMREIISKKYGALDSEANAIVTQYLNRERLATAFEDGLSKTNAILNRLLTSMGLKGVTSSNPVFKSAYRKMDFNTGTVYLSLDGKKLNANDVGELTSGMAELMGVLGKNKEQIQTVVNALGKQLKDGLNNIEINLNDPMSSPSGMGHGTSPKPAPSGSGASIKKSMTSHRDSKLQGI